MVAIVERMQRQSAADSAAHAGLRLWLFAVAGLIFAMVLVGGATRLTDSGLSITEWKPILGAIPPLSEADWQDAFAKYQQIPEYQLINKGMSLAEFKAIYWWEWAHRFLGRFIGFAFFVPFLIFWLRGASPWVDAAAAAIFVLGGAQGALGWYMVQSGLVERTDVSQYRLDGASGAGGADLRLPCSGWRSGWAGGGGEIAHPAVSFKAIAAFRGAGVSADHARRVRRGHRCGAVAQHVAADGRRDHPRAGLGDAALVSQPVRECADDPVQPPHARLC